MAASVRQKNIHRKARYNAIIAMDDQIVLQHKNTSEY